MTKLEQFDYQAAAAVAIVMLGMSLLVLLILNGYQHYRLQRLGA
jgi:sulfate transport system permease protein